MEITIFVGKALLAPRPLPGRRCEWPDDRDGRDAARPLFDLGGPRAEGQLTGAAI